MSNVSIYEKNWIDLVFEDKNKAYGAYQLRQENQKTTLFALLGGVLFVLAAIGLWLFFSSFISDSIVKPIGETGTVITLSDFHPPKTETAKPKKVQTHTQSPAEPTNNLNFLVASNPLVTDNVQTNNNLPTNQNTIPGTGGGIDTPTIGDSAPTTATIPVVDNNPKITSELDRLPEFPGGIKKFYDYVGYNFEKPNVDENVSSMNVIMSFVIEKDGSMTDIKALRSSDKSIEREAIRVLKSLKIKWSPGFKDGEKVRVLYTLPIKVAL
ncbi:energy transducer TonB [Flavobacterium paronense]|uniref:Energy transducer TonB n=1 Tax=Flavobacterium paronense TaxID=1392775 RepID=A0ABV5GAA3_9FLAO|nr:energy transducer TonB [Flavobacterium paronense]MDN3677403.1 energy transducer TonB [Flavobacterium paronense]